MTAGRSLEGLPVGVQLVGPLYEDRTTPRLAELLEPEIGGFRAPGRTLGTPGPVDRARGRMSKDLQARIQAATHELRRHGHPPTRP